MKGYLFLLINIFIFCISCNNSGKNVRKKYFIYNEHVPVSSLDPAMAGDQAMIRAVSQLYTGLVELDSALRPVPALASSWSVSSDALTYTFKIRSGIRFHDHIVFPNGKGRLLTAGDVVYSLSRLLDPATASTGYWIFADKCDTTTVPGPFYRKKSFTALNDSTFELQLIKPVPFILQLLANPYCFIVPHEAVTKYGKDFGRNPVGTGPFKFRFWEENIRLVMDRNPDYFEKNRIHLDGVEVRFIEDKQTAFLEFVQGKLDFFNGIESSFKDMIIDHEGRLKSTYRERFNLVSKPVLNTEYLGFMLDGQYAHPALKDLRVRQAINYAVDRESIVRYLKNNIGTAGTEGIIPDGLPAFSNSGKGFSFDPEKARQLIKDAGYSATNPLRLTLSTNKNYVDMSVLIQRSLKDVGIELAVDVNPGPAHRVKVRKGLISFFRGSWIADYPDAENYLALFYSKNLAPDGPNTFRYNNPAFDALYEESLRTANDTARYKLYTSMDSLIMKDAPLVVLFYDKSFRLSAKNIIGLKATAMNGLDLRDVRKGD